MVAKLLGPAGTSGERIFVRYYPPLHRMPADYPSLVEAVGCFLNLFLYFLLISGLNPM